MSRLIKARNSDGETIGGIKGASRAETTDRTKRRVGNTRTNNGGRTSGKYFDN